MALLPKAIGKPRGFKKGVSGNPKGRGKGVKDRRTLARELVMKYDGITPLEYMLRTLQAPAKQASKVDRQWAAEKAIPYTNRKMPIAIEGGDRPIKVIDVAELSKMSTAELEKLQSILVGLGVAAAIKSSEDED